MSVGTRYIMMLGLVVSAIGAYAPSGDTADAVCENADPVRRHDNYYAAGNDVRIVQPVSGDVVVAGRRISIMGPVAGDILAAGWSVTLAGGASDDVRIAGGEVTVDAPIEGDLTAAGGDVRLGSNAHVTGRAWLTGGTVRVDGSFDRDLQIAGGTVQIGKEIREPLRVVAEKLEIQSTARILAPLTYRSPREASISEGAVVSGPISFQQIPEHEAARARSWPSVSSVLFIVQVFFAGALLVVLIPRLTSSVVSTLRAQPGTSFLVGFIVMVTVPIAALMLVVSIFGLPVGIVMAALYGAALLVGLVTTALVIGEVEIHALGRSMVASRAQQLLVLLAGVVTLAVLRLVPLIGVLTVPASVLFGLGALGLWLYRSFAPPKLEVPA